MLVSISFHNLRYHVVPVVDPGPYIVCLEKVLEKRCDNALVVTEEWPDLVDSNVCCVEGVKRAMRGCGS